MTENWGDVPNYELIYQASDMGRIKSLPRIRKAGRGVGFQMVNDRIKSQRRFDKYPCVDLNKNGIQTTFSVHTLVWTTFKGPIPDGLEINHIDGNKTNNHLSNLELLPHVENMRHAVKNGLWKPNSNPAKGENNGSAKLTDELVRKIKDWIRKGIDTFDTLRRLEELGVQVTISCVQRIRSGKTWKHIP